MEVFVDFFKIFQRFLFDSLSSTSFSLSERNSDYSYNNPYKRPYIRVIGVTAPIMGLYMAVSLNGATPKKHLKMIIFSRKTHGCWVPPF